MTATSPRQSGAFCWLRLYVHSSDLMAVSSEELDNRFAYHSPKPGQAEKYQSIRDKAKEMASLILSEVPESREQSLSITKLEEATMWANASIARRT